MNPYQIPQAVQNGFSGTESEITYYIVERSSPVPHKKIYSIVVAGPFDNEAEAINERVQNYRDIGSLNLWYDVWTDTQLREAGLLP